MFAQIPMQRPFSLARGRAAAPLSSNRVPCHYRGCTLLTRCQSQEPVSKLAVHAKQVSLAAIASLSLFLGFDAQAQVVVNKEVDNESSAYIQALVASSKANKEQYDRERLNDYYRRNFKDYLDFVYGSASANGLSPETTEQIRVWLEKNQDTNIFAKGK